MINVHNELIFRQLDIKMYCLYCTAVVSDITSNGGCYIWLSPPHPYSLQLNSFSTLDTSALESISEGSDQYFLQLLGCHCWCMWQVWFLPPVSTPPCP